MIGTNSGGSAKGDRFIFGLFSERCGAEGHSQSAFQWPNGTTNPYEDAAPGRSGGHQYALPARDGPLPTLALVGVGEGTEDARNLALLPPQARSAFLSDIEPCSTRIGEHLEGHSGNFLDARGWKMARETMKAQRKSP